LSVVNVDGYFEVWKRESLSSKLEIPRFVIDLAFGSSPGQRLDVFYGDQNASVPDAQPSKPEFNAKTNSDSAALPTLIFIHGGYWRALDKGDFSFIARAYAQKRVNVVITNYDLCPSVTLREICLQQANALAWIYRNSETLGLNKNKIVVSGHSAGGHLSALMLAALWPTFGKDLPQDLVKAAVSLSGLFDLRPIAKAPFLAKDLQLSASESIALSPAFMPPATNAPLLTAVGEHESKGFHDQTTILEKAWGNNFRCRIPARGANHFSICDRFATHGDALFEETLGLLRAI
jgi:arylformamidase